MQRFKTTLSLIAAGAIIMPIAVEAAPVAVLNGDFEMYNVPGVLDPANAGHWASEPGTPISAHLDADDEFWTATTGNARWGTGWSTNIDTGGTGLNHPDWGKFSHNEGAAPNTMNNLFGGYFIGHINVADSQGAATKYAQSASVGTVQAGSYIATVAVGFTLNLSRPDVEYRLALVAGGAADGTFGSLGGTILGESSLVMETNNNGDSFATNEQLLTLNLDILGNNAHLGEDLAIRITATNLGTEDGLTQGQGGSFTTNSFSQATFDNVTLDFTAVPEPGSFALLGLGAAVMLRRRRL